MLCFPWHLCALSLCVRSHQDQTQTLSYHLPSLLWELTQPWDLPAPAPITTATWFPPWFNSCVFLSLPTGKWTAANPSQQWVAHHARGTEAARDAAHVHALQVVVLAGFGTLQPFSSRVVSWTHQLDHGGPAGQAPFTLEIGKSKRPSVTG